MTKGIEMRKFFSTLGIASLSALLLAPIALAQAPTVPAVPVGAYGGTLLTALGDAVSDVFPYAAAITAFAIGVGLVRRWLGARKATKV